MKMTRFRLFSLSCLFLVSVCGNLVSKPEKEVSRIVMEELAHQSLTGLWSGFDSDGIAVSYLFEADGSATILENSRPVLGAGGDGSTLRWELSFKMGLGALDLTYTDARGKSVIVPYAVRFSEDGYLVLRSGGKPGKRPSDVLEGEDSMQIRLTRQY